MPKPILSQIRGDGSTTPVSEETLTAIKASITSIKADAASNVWARREINLATRFCIWDGQSDDGRLHKEDLGHNATPYEGASDSRIRLADSIINEHVAEYQTAVRTMPVLTGVDGMDARTAGKLQTFLKWLISSQWGQKYFDDLELIAQWMSGDSPGAAVMGVYWRRERALKNQEITVEDFISMYQEVLGEGEEVAQDLLNILSDPNRIEELMMLISGIAPHLKTGRIKKIAKNLQADGRSSFPVPYVRVNIPVTEALRLYDDIFIPSNTVDIQRARIIHRREWLSLSEVREQAASDEWDPEFVKQLLGDGDIGEETGHESESGFGSEWEYRAELNANMTYELNPYEGLYEVITTYRQAVNDDGIPSIRVCKLSAFCDNTATDEEILDYQHGKYPFIWFARERLVKRLASSRGIPELVMTDQNSLKLIHDHVDNHVEVNTNPPAITPSGSPRYELSMGPYGQIRGNPRSEPKFITRPPFPKTALEHKADVRFQVAEYFGRNREGVPDELVLTLRQTRINKFLSGVSGVLKMALQLSQQYLDAEQWQRVVGGAGVEQSDSIEEIQGMFDVTFSVDVRDWDMTMLIKKAEAMLKHIKPMDVRSTLQYDKIVDYFMVRFDPNLAEVAQVPVEAADAKEAEEERQNLIKMLNGLEPEMTEGGINANLRMQVLQQDLQPRLENPAAFPPISPATQALIENRMKYLQFQGQQMENAQIGRMGTEPVNLTQVQGEEPGR